MSVPGQHRAGPSYPVTGLQGCKGPDEEECSHAALLTRTAPPLVHFAIQEPSLHTSCVTLLPCPCAVPVH